MLLFVTFSMSHSTIDDQDYLCKIKIHYPIYHIKMNKNIFIFESVHEYTLCQHYCTHVEHGRIRFSSNYFLEFSNAKASRMASYNEALCFYNHYQCKNLQRNLKFYSSFKHRMNIHCYHITAFI